MTELQGPPKRYKRPESVLVVVYTLGGEFLLMRRTQPSDFWQSVTGSLRAGEAPRSTAIRELHEETGIQAGAALVDLGHAERFPIIMPWRKRYAPGVHYNLEHWFALRLPCRRLVRLNPAEHAEYHWLKAQRAIRLASSYTNRQAIALLRLANAAVAN